MNKKISLFMILGLFLMSLMSVSVMAHNKDGIGFQASLGNIAEGTGDTATTLLNITVNLPFYDGEVSMLALILTFILLLTILLVAAKKIPVFKDEETAKQRKTFAVALSLLLIFFTPIPQYVMGFLWFLGSTFAAYAVIVAAIVLVVGVWRWGRRGVTNTTDPSFYQDAKATRQAKYVNDKYKKEVNTDKKYAKKIDKRDARAIGKLEKLTKQEQKGKKNLIQGWRTALKQLENLHHKLSPAGEINNAETQHLRDILLQEIGNLFMIEDKESQINAKISELASMLVKDEVEAIKKLNVADTTIRNNIMREAKIDPAHKNAARQTDKIISQAKAFAIEAERLTRVIYNQSGDVNKHDSQLRGYEQSLSDHLRASPVRVDDAIDDIKVIIRELEVEQKAYDELLNLENNLKKKEMQSFKLVNIANLK